jgi:hypothetical protein
MSVWIVSSAHIDVLVLAGVQFGLLDRPGPEVLTELGADLWAENHRSANHRSDLQEQPPPYCAPVAEVLLDPVAVVKAVDCYTYQSCEHPKWTDSRAAAYCTRLRSAAMTGLPIEHTTGGTPYPAGWDQAPWGIDTLADACSRTGCPGGFR